MKIIITDKNILNYVCGWLSKFPRYKIWDIGSEFLNYWCKISIKSKILFNILYYSSHIISMNYENICKIKYI